MLPGTRGAETAFAASVSSYLIGRESMRPDRKRFKSALRKSGPVAERKQFIEDWRAGIRRDLTARCLPYGISRKTEHK